MSTPFSRRTLFGASTALVAGGLARPAYAQGAGLKIGLITTLTGPGGYLGQDIRDAFLLAVELEGGKLGGVPVNVMVEDDGFKPGQGKQVAEKFMQNEKIKLFTGIVFSNILGATVPDILDGDGYYFSPNASPSNLAGKDCNKNFWSVAWQNDSLHESAGQAAQNAGYKRMFILAPNYQAGKDALTGFKRLFKGEIAGEVYTRLDQTDYAAEMAQIRAAKPDAVFQFHPGGLGIGFMRQYAQAGLLQTIPQVVAAPSMDSVTVKAVGDAAIGITCTSQWNTDFTNETSKAFVAAFQKKYNRLPTYYAQQGFDTALAMASGLKATRGTLDGAFRTAVNKADFQSARGKFAFGPNQHPIQDWYLLKVEKGSDGAPTLVTQPGKVLENHGDAYSAACKM